MNGLAYPDISPIIFSIGPLAVREALKSCGLEQDTSCVGADHDVWHAEGGVTIEPHKSLMSLTDFAGYFTDFWQNI